MCENESARVCVCVCHMRVCVCACLPPALSFLPTSIFDWVGVETKLLLLIHEVVADTRNDGDRRLSIAVPARARDLVGQVGARPSFFCDDSK
jgi:hypothetical protein